MIVGAVLAAGAGTRYGEPKIGAHQGDWLRAAVEALVVGGCDEVLVAMGARVVDVPGGASTLVVAEWADGMSATVRAVATEAVTRTGLDGLLLHVVDTPDVGPAVVRRVLDAADRAPRALVRAVYTGRPGHPVYVGADHLPAMSETLHGDSGARGYLSAHTGSVVEVECGDLATGVDRDEQ